MSRIYLTHCSAKKDKSLRYSSKQVSPDGLYIAAPTQRFMNMCKNKNVKWAIFSDKYGIWFPQEKHVWYEKNPDTVTAQEFDNLVKDFENKLMDYDEIYFYYNPGRFHRLYDRLLNTVKIEDRIFRISHLSDIE